jgi:two-component system OmpR family response regulator
MSAPKSLRLFLVEDSPVIRENLAATLEELLSAKVVGSAETEAAATDWLLQNLGEWDLAIVDVFLRQGSGLGVLSALDRRPASHKLVVLSNYATPDMRKKCLELGANQVFDKSNEIDTLISYCERVAAQQGEGLSRSGMPL